MTRSAIDVPAFDTPAAVPVQALVIGMEWFAHRPGGLNRYVRDQLHALLASGIDVRAVMVGSTSGAPPQVFPADHGRLPYALRLLPIARTASRTVRPDDVVDAHFAFYALLSVTMTKLRHHPLVVHFHGPWADEARISSAEHPVASSVKRAIERAVYRRAEVVVVLSEAFRAVVVDRYGVADWRVHVVPPTVDLDHFRPGDVEAARARLGLPTGAFVAVVARRLERRMGFESLLEAWPAVVAARPDAVLVVVGSGPMRHELEDKVATLGLEGSVRFAGQVSDDDLVMTFQAADVSVVPTLHLEGFGLVVLESLATGTPVVATDVGGLAEALNGLDGSDLVAAGDQEGLAESILAVAAGRGATAKACRAHAESFSPQALAARHERLYRLAGAEAGERRPRVVFVDHCALRSGGELALARLLPHLDVDAHVVLGEDGPLVELLRAQGTSTEVLALSGDAHAVRKDDIRPGGVPLGGILGAGRSVLALRRRLRQLRPDVVHTNSLKAALYGGLAAKLAGIPVVWHVRDRIATDYLPGVAVRLVRALARHVPDAIVANSASTLATLGATGKPSYVVSSPVPAAERATGSPDGDVVVGMVGRLAAWKGQHVFLQAFEAAFPSGGARAVLVGGALFGEDDYACELRELADRPALRGRVEIMGHVDDVAGQLDRFDVLVHASVVPEPFGQVVVEGMAAGIPVVASDAGGPAEVISHGVDGLLHRPGDVADLASCLTLLASSPARRAALAEAGRNRARDFEPTEVAASVLAVYRDLSAVTQRR